MNAVEHPRLVDCSHVVESGMVTYPGLPGPVVDEHLSRAASREVYAPGTEFHIGRIQMVANTGTYLDAPFHRFAGGDDLADLPLRCTVDLPLVLVRVADRVIEPASLAGREVRGRAVVFATGWDRHWGTDAYAHGHPHLSAATAELLVRGGAALVGIDSLNIDGTHDGERPVHTALLAAGIPIVEHLCNLDQVREPGRFFAAPVAVRGLGTFPVRAFVLLDPAP
ncbi:MAG TPA: cyclase family protein [Acidimicrobiia bacterium]|nr:cyclase family protein [Acidimicrobiia bacterium]